MSYLAAAHTDQGISKQSNQDSLCVKEANTLIGGIVMAVLCDGMGGLAKGEVASASVILAFAKWFDEELPRQITLDNYEEDIKLRWNEIIQAENEKIGRFGKGEDIQLGTTLTALLIINSEKFLIAHVGDSRAYYLDGEKIQQITEDQTVVASEVKAGRLTREEALLDPRQSVLLQCIGASRQVIPQFIEGSIERNGMFLLCSDGFRHVVSDTELHEVLNPRFINDEESMKNGIVRLTQLNKDRKETDNISSILLKIV